MNLLSCLKTARMAGKVKEEERQDVGKRPRRSLWSGWGRLKLSRISCVMVWVGDEKGWVGWMEEECRRMLATSVWRRSSREGSWQ